MTSPARTIPVCPDCLGTLEFELVDFFCRACQRTVPFTAAVFFEDGDPDD